MILGLGIDIVKIKRIEKIFENYPLDFPKKILHPLEFNKYSELKEEAMKIAFLAKKWAVKESAVKAIGCGFIPNISYHNIAILNNSLGMPCIHYESLTHNAIITILNSRFPQLNLEKLNWHVSLADEREYVSAVSIIEAYL